MHAPAQPHRGRPVSAARRDPRAARVLDCGSAPVAADTMPASPAVARYFFSYAREDGDFVLRLAKDLRAAGVDLWLDQLDILGGQRWDEAVEAALQACPGMITVLSPAAIASQNCLDEISYALEEEKQVIPVLHQPCAIPFRLRRVQYVDFTAGYAEGLAALARALDVEPPARPGVGAAEGTGTAGAAARAAADAALDAGYGGDRDDGRAPRRPGHDATTGAPHGAALGPGRLAAAAVAGVVLGTVGGLAEKALRDPWVLTLGILALLLGASVASLVHYLRARGRGLRLAGFELEALLLWGTYTLCWSLANRWWSDFYMMMLMLWAIVAVVGGVAIAATQRAAASGG